MTSAPINQSAIARVSDMAGDCPPLRMRLKPKAHASGCVDGGWWPYSRDLIVELVPLLGLLRGSRGTGARVIRAERVTYNQDAWGPTDRTVLADGSLIRLQTYRPQHPNIIHLIGRDERLTLLVVPPESTAEAGQRALMTAAQPGNADSVERLLRPDPPPTGAPGSDEPAEDEEGRELVPGRDIQAA